LVGFFKKKRRKTEMAEKEGGSSFLVGFIIGAIAGVAIGFLYAPKAGKETRSILKEKAGQLKDKAGEIISRARESGKD
jgi:gas vesicle protein